VRYAKRTGKRWIEMKTEKEIREAIAKAEAIFKDEKKINTLRMLARQRMTDLEWVLE
jgi:hypothetical protein